MLKYPDYDLPFKLTTDTSEFAVGAVLFQEKEGMDMLIAHPIQRYEDTEKECLAVLYSLENFPPYLYGQEFILASGHEPVVWMTYVENPRAQRFLIQV